MAFIGMKHPVFAPKTSVNSDGTYNYGPGLIVGRAMSANVEITLADAKLYADDVVVENDNGFTSGSITFGVDNITLETQQRWLGSRTGTLNGVTVTIDSGVNVSPEGGYGYYRVGRLNGVRFIRAFWFPRTQFGLPSEDAQTKGDTIEWQTPEVEGQIMALENIDNDWRYTSDFANEVDAVAWLDELAHIGQPVDKTALVTAISAASILDSEDYTSASWVAVANGLSVAQTVNALPDPAQSRVDSATSTLNNAVAALVER